MLVLFVALGVHFHTTSWLLVLACVYTTLLMEIAIIDFHYRLVLNLLSYPAVLVAFAGSFLWTGIGPTSALLGGAISFVSFLIIEFVGHGAMGRGDTKLATLIGVMRGFPGVASALIGGVITGGVMAALLLVTGRGRRSTFAYGPALAIGAFISFFISQH